MDTFYQNYDTQITWIITMFPFFVEVNYLKSSETSPWKARFCRFILLLRHFVWKKLAEKQVISIRDGTVPSLLLLAEIPNNHLRCKKTANNEMKYLQYQVVQDIFSSSCHPKWCCGFPKLLGDTLLSIYAWSVYEHPHTTVYLIVTRQHPTCFNISSYWLVVKLKHPRVK